MLRVGASKWDALRPILVAAQSAAVCVPTQSVGTRKLNKTAQGFFANDMEMIG
jgi:hypothetical protein